MGWWWTCYPWWKGYFLFLFALCSCKVLDVVVPWKEANYTLLFHCSTSKEVLLLDLYIGPLNIISWFSSIGWGYSRLLLYIKFMICWFFVEIELGKHLLAENNSRLLFKQFSCFSFLGQFWYRVMLQRQKIFLKCSAMCTILFIIGVGSPIFSGKVI